MAIYKFTEVDNTRVSTVKNDNSNYVFLPINSTWGPSDKPVAIQSLAELKEYLGEDAEAGSEVKTITSYQYATDIIKSGFCVLAKRLAIENTNESASAPARQKEYKEIRINYGSKISNQTLEVRVGSTKETDIGTVEEPKHFNSDTEKKVYTYTASESERPKEGCTSYSIDNIVFTTPQGKEGEFVASYSEDEHAYKLTSKTGESAGYEYIEAYFTLNSYMPDGAKALYLGSFGNNLKTSFSTKVYGANQKLLIMSTYNKTDGSRLEDTPLGLIKIGTGGNDTFTPANGVTSDYIDIEDIDAEIVTGKSATETKTNTTYIYFENGADITRDEAIAIAADVYEFKKQEPDQIDNDLANKWLYDIKFLCNGGLIDSSTSATMAANMISIANERQDCIAFIDCHKVNKSEQVEDFFKGANIEKTSYAAAYAPWCSGTAIGSTTVVDIPASYYVITSMAKSFMAGNNVCLPPAGVNRGIVNIKQPAFNIGNITMEKWQGNTGEMTFCINPIMNVRKYGYCIFGQRNLYELPYGQSSALQEIGVRLTLNEVKKWVRDVAVSLTFESNTNRTWNEFVSKVQTCLDKLVADGLLTQYSIERNSDITDQINTNTLSATIRVYVTRALENFDITVEVNSGDITFDEAYTG